MQLRDLLHDVLFQCISRSIRELNVKIIAEKAGERCKKSYRAHLSDFVEKFVFAAPGEKENLSELGAMIYINHRHCFRRANFISAHDSFAAPIAQNRAKARTT